MDKFNLNKYKRRLLKEKKKINYLINNIRGENLLSKAEEFNELSSADNHPSDSASEIFEMEKNLALEENEKIVLKKIDNALRDIQEGTYGICEICGKEISPERLNIIPYTDHCIKCEDKMLSSYENGEKRPKEEYVMDYSFGYKFNNKNIENDITDAYPELGMVNLVDNLQDYDYYYIENQEGYVEPIERVSNEQYKNSLPY